MPKSSPSSKTEALATRGVAAIFTGADVAADKLNGVPCAWGIVGTDGTPMNEPPHPLLAHGEVRHVGDPVALVIADSVEAARSAAERTAVDYRILPAVTEAAAAAAPGAPQLYDDVPGQSLLRLGDRRYGGDRGRLFQGASHRQDRSHQ